MLPENERRQSCECPRPTFFVACNYRRPRMQIQRYLGNWPHVQSPDHQFHEVVPSKQQDLLSNWILARVNGIANREKTNQLWRSISRRSQAAQRLRIYQADV